MLGIFLERFRRLYAKQNVHSYYLISDYINLCCCGLPLKTLLFHYLYLKICFNIFWVYCFELLFFFILIFIFYYVIIPLIGNENKQMWFATFNPQLYVVRMEVVHMIEAILFNLIYLLLFGLITETIVVFALIILIIFLSK